MSTTIRWWLHCRACAVEWLGPPGQLCPECGQEPTRGQHDRHGERWSAGFRWLAEYAEESAP